MRIESEQLLAKLYLAWGNTTQGVEQLSRKDLEETESLLAALGGVKNEQKRALEGLELNQFAEALTQPNQKLILLQQFQRHELIALLHLMEKEQLLWGLRFFPKERLLQLFRFLPKRQLIKLLRAVIPLDKLIQKLPTEEILAVMHSERIDHRALLKGFAQLDPKFVLRLLSKITGKPTDGMKLDEVIKTLFYTPRHQIMEGLKDMGIKGLTPFVGFFIERDPELLLNLSNRFIFRQFEMTTMPNLIEGMRVFPKELIIQFLDYLPTHQLTLVAKDIDDSILMGYLLSEQPEIFGQLLEELTAA